MAEVLDGKFQDAITYDAKTKRAISVRDGTLEYYGHELGIEPHEKVFKVYRSPATIAQVSHLMKTLPLTDGHVDLDSAVIDPAGEIKDARVVDHYDQSSDSKLAIENDVIFTDGNKYNELSEKHKELSLGYKAELIECQDYDFEQRNIRPHHLAVIEHGRCGAACTFLDKKTVGEDMSKKQKFIDEDGNPNLEEIMKIAQALPEALKRVDIDTLKDVMPRLQEIVNKAQEGSQMPEEGQQQQDMDKKEEDDMQDEKKPDDEMQDHHKDFADSQQFKDAVKSAVDDALVKHSKVVDKARHFVDSKYSFDGKSTKDIMIDALKTEYDDLSDFADEEISTAFKLLKKSKGNLENFGDQQNLKSFGKLDEIKDKEL